MADPSKSTAVLEPEAPPDPAAADTEWDPQLAETLYRILSARRDLGGSAFEATLRTLEKRHGEILYSELIHLLSHLRFPAAQARRYWNEIVRLRDDMERRLGSFVDVRVSLAAYFVQVNRKLRSPKLIELRLFEKTRACAYRDELTGLPNYRFFMESLEREIQRALRSSQPVSLVMIDVDNFKEFNDRHGHDAGNTVLSETGRLLAFSLRRLDVTCRYGGEEFALILPATAKPDAQVVAERARTTMENHEFSYAPGQGGRITVSMGVATCPADASEARGLVRCADRALYAAKSGGRNQVQLYGLSRRSFRRVTAALSGTCRSLAGDELAVTTMNLSEGGVRFHAGRSLPVGVLVELQLALPFGGGAIALAGRVVSCIPATLEGFEIAVRIVSIETRDRILLSRHIADLCRASEEAAAAPIR